MLVIPVIQIIYCNENYLISVAQKLTDKHLFPVIKCPGYFVRCIIITGRIN